MAFDLSLLQLREGGIDSETHASQFDVQPLFLPLGGFRKLEGKDLVVSLLPVLDDFERALRAMETATDVAPVKEGVTLIQSKLKGALTKHGLKEMESIGTPFDPELQEAITNIPAPTDDLKGKVVDEMEKGYFLNDKVVRFAKVIVGA